MTMDVDLVLGLDEENIARFIQVANQLGLVPCSPVSIDDLSRPDKRQSWIREKNMTAFSLRGQSPSTPTVDILNCRHSDWRKYPI